MSKHRILRRVREALERRDPVEHPGAFGSWRRDGGNVPWEAGAVHAFQAAFQAAGGRVERVDDDDGARARIAELADGVAGISAGSGVPAELLPDLPRLEPADAPLGVSMARGAVAETGSLLMDARDGRRAQLLPPVHLVLVREADVFPTLAAALAAVAPDLPSGLGLHSGPSKSADIGQILVEGVHGPGRVVALVVASPAAGRPPGTAG